MRPQGWEWIIILVIVVLLWGSTKLPGAAKGIAQSIKVFKKELSDDKKPADKDSKEKADKPSED